MADTPNTRRPDATWRAIALGLCLIPPNAYWIAQVEGVWDTGHSTCLSLMWHVVVNLLLVMLLNLVLKRVAPKAALNAAELLTVYAMLTLAGAIVGRDSFQILVPVVSWPFRHATSENEWDALFLRFLPRWPTIRDPETLDALYQGGSLLYVVPNLRALWVPVLGWTLFAGLLGWVCLCMNAILRKQWTDSERLSYPIIQLPMAIIEDGGSTRFFRNKLLLIGFAIGGGIDLLNGSHYLWPSLPHLPVTYQDHDVGRYFTAKPWNAMGNVPVPLYPFAIALGFFLPLDLAFSTWFFYVVRKLQQVLGTSLGFANVPGFPYRNQQSTGAWLAICVVVLWMARKHLAHVLRVAVGTEPDAADPDEPIRYRLAVLGLALGILALGAVCIQMGMSVWITGAFLTIWIMLSVSITRARAELGPPTHELVNMNASFLLIDLFGTRGVGAQSLSVFPMFWWFSGRGYRDHLMPHQLESLKMASILRARASRLCVAMILAVIVGALASFWALLDVMFREGLGHMLIGHDSSVYRTLEAQLTFPQGTDVGATLFVGLGVLVTFALMALRTQFLWWPLHPLGYALSMNFGVDYIWTCLLVASVAKLLVLRYGGLHTYRRAVPLAFGVILGEYVVGASWSLLAVLLRRRMYDFYFA